MLFFFWPALAPGHRRLCQTPKDEEWLNNSKLFTPERLAAFIRQYRLTLYFTQKHTVKADSCRNTRTIMSCRMCNFLWPVLDLDLFRFVTDRIYQWKEGIVSKRTERKGQRVSEGVREMVKKRETEAEDRVTFWVEQQSQNPDVWGGWSGGVGGLARDQAQRESYTTSPWTQLLCL